MKFKNLFLTLLTLVAFTTAQAQDKEATIEAAPMQGQSDVIDIAMASSAHNTLVAAVKASDLVPTLKGKGPFTIFAPTDAAFNKLPEGTVDFLLQKANKNQLRGVLSYHVVAGKFTSSDLVAAIKQAPNEEYFFKTVLGDNLVAKMVDGTVRIADKSGNTATVTAADNMASNGVIHVIDTVLMPKKKAGVKSK